MHTTFPRYKIKCYLCKNIKFPLLPLYSLAFPLKQVLTSEVSFYLHHFDPSAFGLLWSSMSDWLSACMDFLSVVGVPVCPPSVSLSPFLVEKSFICPFLPSLYVWLLGNCFTFVLCSRAAVRVPSGCSSWAPLGLPLPVTLAAPGTPHPRHKQCRLWSCLLPKYQPTKTWCSASQEPGTPKHLESFYLLCSSSQKTHTDNFYLCYLKIIYMMQTIYILCKCTFFQHI